MAAKHTDDIGELIRRLAKTNSNDRCKVDVTLELPAREWLVITEAAMRHGYTIEQIIQATIRESDALMEASGGNDCLDNYVDDGGNDEPQERLEVN
jgi:hypothetical protein